MRLLSQYLPERIRKRTFVVLAIVILLVTILAGIVLWSAKAYIAPENARIFVMPPDTSGQYIAGLGVNLQSLPSANLIQNGAFDQPLVQTQYLVNDGSADKFSVTASESIGNLPLTDDYFKGADITIFRSGNEGMQKIHSASISDYEIGRFLNQTALELAEGLDDVHWYDFAESDTDVERVVAAGSDGNLLSIEKSGEVQIIKSGHIDDITSIVYGSDGFLAVDRGGRFYVSDEGLDFTELELRGTGPLLDVAYRADAGGDSGFYLAAGQSGQLYLGRGREFEQIKLKHTESLNALIVPEEGIMYALGDNGSAFYSHNGIDWSQDMSLSVSNDWLCGDTTGDVMFFAGSQGLMAIKRGDDEFEVLDPQILIPLLGPGQDLEIVWPDLREVSLFSSEHIIMISESGNAFQSLNQSQDWEQLSSSDISSAAVTNIDRLPSGRVFLARQDGNIDWATFSSVFTFSPALPSGVLSGDYVTVDLATTYAFDTAQLPDLYPVADETDGEWLISGGVSASIVPLAASGYDVAVEDLLVSGKPRGSILRLKNSENEKDASYREDDARLDQKRLFSLQRKALINDQILNPMRPYLNLRLAQKIDTSNLIRPVEPSVFPLEFDVCLEGENEGLVEICISGSNFEVSEEFELKPGWQHINTLILLPRPLNPHDQLYFNIGFAGDATFYLDNIFMGRTDESPNDMSTLAKNIVSDAPDIPVLRLECVPIGKQGYQPNSWALPEGETGYQASHSIGSDHHNLGAVLQLVEAVNASPWLLVDARAGDEEIHNLLEYLAGSPLSGYGKIRASNGVIGSWTDTFDLVYLEVVDSSDALPSDYLKAQRVDWVVDQCQSSPLYQEISNRMVFIDGMDYEEGGLRTNVDFHASTMYCNQRLSGSAALDTFLADWKQSLPRRAIVGSVFRPELISSLSFEGAVNSPVRLADLAALSLSGLGNETELVLLDVDLLNQSYYEGENVQTALLALADLLEGAKALESTGREQTVASTNEALAFADSVVNVNNMVGEENHSLLLFPYKMDEAYLLLAVNLGENAEQFALRGLTQVESIALRSFDSSGRLIAENLQSHTKKAFSVMPGAIIVLEIKLSA